jgi:membrane protein
MSIVPVFALAFGIAKGFALDELLEASLLTHLESQTIVVSESIQFAKNLLENTKGGIIAGTGVIALLWTVLQVLNHIEDAFNKIWAVTKGRNWQRKGADYLAICLICPILLIISQGASLFLIQKSSLFLNWISLPEQLSNSILFFLHFLKYFTLWTVLTLLYLVMPNTQVRASSALFSGVITGSLCLLFQWIYLTFQIGINHYGAIYGSFVALPLFLFWLNINWYIILYGAELAFSHQNISSFECEESALDISFAQKKLYSLYLVQHMVNNLIQKKQPETPLEIANSLHLPIRLVKRLLRPLINQRILLETPHKDSMALSLACDLNTLSISHVINSVDHHGNDSVFTENSNINSIKERLLHFEKLIENSPHNNLIKELLNKREFRSYTFENQ